MEHVLKSRSNSVLKHCPHCKGLTSHRGSWSVRCWRLPFLLRYLLTQLSLRLQVSTNWLNIINHLLFCDIMQGDSTGKFNNVGGDSIRHFIKKVHMNMCLVLNAYRDTAVSISRPNCVRFFVCGFGWREKFTKDRWTQETNCSLAFWMLLPA